jgi:hypothetical protein
MTRARDVADTQDNLGGAVAPFVAGKNGVINGGMDIWQRGISGTYTAGPVYTADRFSFNCSATTSITVSQITTSDTTNLPNIYNAMRVQRTAGNTSTPLVLIQNSIESKDSYRFAGQNVTFSFWARKGANFSSSTFTAQVISGTGTDQSLVSGFTNSNALISQSPTLTTTWQRFSYTGAVSSTATQLGFQFFITCVGTAGAADYFDITGIQLEIGSVATPFSRAGGSIGGELALCQRYFERLNANSGTVFAPFGSGACTSTVQTFSTVTFLTKRASPSVSFSTAGDFAQTLANGNAATCTAISSAASGPDAVLVLTSVASGLVAGNASILYRLGGSAAYIDISAEL